MYFARQLLSQDQMVRIGEEFGRASQTNSIVAVIELVEIFNGLPKGALKILNNPDRAVNAETARQRLKQEIEVLKVVRHRNIVRILDSDRDHAWFVTEFFPRGTLSNNQAITLGDVPASLRLIRGVAEGVAVLHERSIVHRDIKPENLFLSDEGRLVLGDFGLVHPEEADRLTRTSENAGTRRFMPGWAMDRRMAVVPPEFDIFSLAKVLWTLVAGRDYFPLHYWRESGDNLGEIFPENRDIILVNDILDRTVTNQLRDQRIRTAVDFLSAIEDALAAVGAGSPVPDSVAGDPRQLFSGTWKLTYKTGKSSGTETFSIDEGMRYIINGEPVFKTRVIAWPRSSTALFEKKRIKGDEVLIELLELVAGMERKGHDQNGTELEYEKVAADTQ